MQKNKRNTYISLYIIKHISYPEYQKEFKISFIHWLLDMSIPEIHSKR